MGIKLQGDLIVPVVVYLNQYTRGSKLSKGKAATAEELFCIETKGPHPGNPGGTRYWMCD